jgi:uncharacterized protein with von Willebrand factor type A (vWA) domain
MISNQTPPLFDLFLYLRDTEEFTLTLDQYHVLLSALDNGFGLSSREDLKNICFMLWVKAKPDSEIAKKFSQYFDAYFAKIDVENQKIQKPEPVPKSVESVESEPVPVESEPVPSFLQPPIALQGGILPKNKFNINTKFTLAVTDFPMTERKIRRSFNYLRLPVRQGNLTEVDIDATVDKIGEDGFLITPVMITRRINRAEVLLLVDVSNSMIPFFLVSQLLVDNLQGTKLGKAEVYYFRNCPGEYLFYHPQNPGGKLTSEVLAKLHQQRTVVLIISDAGAARGGLNDQRIELTKDFLDELYSCVRQVAWLNPVPENRWRGTSAQGISQLVKMYDLDNSGLVAAVRRR